MSLIHGMICFDDCQPDAESLRPMLEAGEHACPDGAEIWYGDGAVLGLGLLQTLPHARTARGPVHDPESGLTIVGDVRLDNRPELCGQLDIRDGDRFSDAEVLLLAYRQWDEACIDRLIGDFAFVIWDARKRRLFCGRDIFGMRPFYYRHFPGRCIFSSSLNSLIRLAEVPCDLDEEMVAVMLAGLFPAQDRTLYSHIDSLPPAHCMTVGENGATMRRYWQPQAGYPIRFSRDEEYVEAFRELLEQAIACRIETDGSVAGMLSGGLDSGSIAAIAGRQLAEQGRSFSTFSFVLADDQRGREKDERELIERVHGLAGIDGHFITTHNFSPASDLYGDMQARTYPGKGPQLATLFQRLHAAGARVVLDGFGGDQCATIGSTIPLAEFLPFHPARLLRHLSESGRYYECSGARFLGGMLRKQYGRVGARNTDEQAVERSALSQGFRERIGIRKLLRQHGRIPLQRPRSLAETMVRNLLGRRVDDLALFSDHQAERRFPFFDRRLVEFCLSVPSEQHHYDMNRRLIRRAMSGLLPDEIRLRDNKDICNTPGSLSFLNKNRDFFIASIEAVRHDDAIKAYIDLDKLYQRFTRDLPKELSAAGGADFMPGATMRAFNMLMFLQRHFGK